MFQHYYVASGAFELQELLDLVDKELGFLVRLLGFVKRMEVARPRRLVLQQRDLVHVTEVVRFRDRLHFVLDLDRSNRFFSVLNRRIESFGESPPLPFRGP